MTKILVVDDEIDFLFTFKSFFESRGYKVFIAPRGLDAINVLKSERPDVMILDLKMKDMSGIDVLTKTKDLLPRVKTFVVTGSYEDEIKSEVVALGALDVIPKPVRLIELEKRIADATK